MGTNKTGKRILFLSFLAMGLSFKQVNGILGAGVKILYFELEKFIEGVLVPFPCNDSRYHTNESLSKTIGKK